MAPYEAAPADGPPLSAGDDADSLAAWDAALLAVVDVEGPMLVRRLLRAVEKRAAAGGLARTARKQRVNRRSAALVLARELVEVDDGYRPTGQQDKVVRHPDQPDVLLRTRGPRDILEIPRREIAECARVLAQHETVSIERVLEAYQVPPDLPNAEARAWVKKGMDTAG